MKVGRLPCQEEALREEIAGRRSDGGGNGVSRRGWILVVGGALCSGVTGYWMGLSGGLEKEPVDPRILWARRMASEETPIEELLANSQAFVRQLIARSYEDPIVWAGVARLCDALKNGQTALSSQVKRELAYLIAATIRVSNPPRRLRMFEFLPTLDRLSR